MPCLPCPGCPPLHQHLCLRPQRRHCQRLQNGQLMRHARAAPRACSRPQGRVRTSPGATIGPALAVRTSSGATPLLNGLSQRAARRARAKRPPSSAQSKVRGESFGAAHLGPKAASSFNIRKQPRARPRVLRPQTRSCHRLLKNRSACSLGSQITCRTGRRSRLYKA